jgi:hypothetical protein
MLLRIFFLYCCVCLHHGSIAQTLRRTIVLADSASGQPLSYVSIVRAGSMGFVSDIQGQVLLEGDAQTRFVFFCIGYRTRELDGDACRQLDTLWMHRLAQTLDAAKIYSPGYFRTTKTIGRIDKGDFSYACDSSFDHRAFAIVIDLRKELPAGTEVVWIRKLTIPLRKDRAEDRQVHPMKILITESLTEDTSALLNREAIVIDQRPVFGKNGTVTLNLPDQHIYVAPRIIYIQLKFLRESPAKNYSSPQIYISGKSVDNFFSLHRNLPSKSGLISEWTLVSKTALTPFADFSQGNQSVWNVPMEVEVGY